jgi:hypothetical protein
MIVRALILAFVLLVPTFAVAGTADQLEREHGTGQIRNGNRAWSGAELKILDASLSVLDRKEKRALKDVDFVRMRWSMRPFGAGLYKVDGRGNRILIYDRAFSGAGKGSSKKPNRTIVHEVGHAIAHWKTRKELARANRLVDSANNAVRGYNNEIRRYNQQVRRYNRTRNAADKRSLDAIQRKVESLGSGLERKKRDALKAKRRVNAVARFSRPPFVRTGILVDYRKILRGRLGPTPYGRRNLSESFAESFSLHHCEPKALKKVLPKVQEWFQQNRHHGAME